MLTAAASEEPSRTPPQPNAGPEITRQCVDLAARQHVRTFLSYSESLKLTLFTTLQSGPRDLQ